MFKFFCVFLSILAGSAMAETVDLGSQYQHQAGDKKIELTPGFGWNETNASDVSYKGWGGAVRAEYGTSDMMSIGFFFDFESVQYTTNRTITQKGLRDPAFFLNTRQMVGPGSLRYGFVLDMAVEDRIIGSSGDTNQSSGGVSAKPYVGYEWQTGPHTLGARISYSAGIHDGRFQNKTTTPETEGRINGGNSLYSALFYETDVTPLILGASIGLRNTDRTHQIVKGVTADNDSSFSSIRGQIYGAWLMTSAATLLPSIAYTDYTATDVSFDHMHTWEFSLGARFEF